MNAVVPPCLTGIGLYPLPEAARLAQLDTRTARRWAEGYSFSSHGERRISSGVMPLALPRIGKERDVTFAELLTLRLVRGFRAAGLGLATIKRVAARAAVDFGLPMPFVSRRFRTDGRKVFIELRQRRPDNDEPAVPRKDRELIEVLTGQQAFADVVEPSLFADVDWQDDLASRWWPLGTERSVLVDPNVMFGTPRLNGTSVPTAVVAAAVKAEGGGDNAAAAVADWFGVTVPAVWDAVKFETEWLSPAAWRFAWTNRWDGRWRTCCADCVPPARHISMISGSWACTGRRMKSGCRHWRNRTSMSSSLWTRAS